MDTTKDPMWVTVTVIDIATEIRLGIFRIVGDELHLNQAIGGNTRPTKFDKGAYATLKRQAEKDGQQAVNLNSDFQRAAGGPKGFGKNKMISEALHLLACIALVVAALHWKRDFPRGSSSYRRLLPFILAAGILGFVILYRYGMEFFVASYSGAIYEVEAPGRGAITLIAISAIFSALPLAGLLPMIGRQASAVICIGCLAATPSLLALLTSTLKHQVSHHNQLPDPSSISRGDYNPQPESKPRSR